MAFRPGRKSGQLPELQLSVLVHKFGHVFTCCKEEKVMKHIGFCIHNTWPYLRTRFSHRLQPVVVGCAIYSRRSRLKEPGPHAEHGLKPVPNGSAGSESRGRHPYVFDHKCGCALPTRINPAYRGALGHAFPRKADDIVVSYDLSRRWRDIEGGTPSGLPPGRRRYLRQPGPAEHSHSRP